MNLDIEFIISLGIVLVFTVLVFYTCRSLGYKAFFVFVVALAATLPFANAPPPDDDIEVITKHTQFPINTITSFTLSPKDLNYYRPVMIRIVHVYHNFWDRNYVGFRIGGSIIFAAIALLTSALTLMLFKRKDVALLAGLVFAIHPAAVISTVFITPKGFGVACAMIALIGFIKQMASTKENRLQTIGQVVLVCMAMLCYEDNAAFLGVFIAAALWVGNLPLKKAIVKSSPYWGMILVIFLIKFINLTSKANDETAFDFGAVGRFWDYAASFFLPFARSLDLPERFDLLTIADTSCSFPAFFSGGLEGLNMTHWFIRIVTIALIGGLMVAVRRDSRRFFLLAGAAILTIIPSLFTSSMNYLLISPVIFMTPLVAQVLINQFNFTKLKNIAILVMLFTFLFAFSFMQIRKISVYANVEGIKSLYLVTKNLGDYPDVRNITSDDLPRIRRQADNIIPNADKLQYRDID